MTDINTLKEGLCALISRKTNIPAVSDRMKGKAESAYIVTIDENEGRLIAGGTQLERLFTVSVLCYFSKAENEEGVMRKRLYNALFPYFTLGGRSFEPLDARFVKAEDYPKLMFEAVMCDSLDMEEIEYSLMGNIKFDIISGGFNGITTDSYQL